MMLFVAFLFPERNTELKQNIYGLSLLSLETVNSSPTVGLDIPCCPGATLSDDRLQTEWKEFFAPSINTSVSVVFDKTMKAGMFSFNEVMKIKLLLNVTYRRTSTVLLRLNARGVY